jgi:hypothetical protein
MEMRHTHTTFKGHTAVAVPWGPRVGAERAKGLALAVTAIILLAAVAILAIGRATSGAATTAPALPDVKSYSVAQLGLHDAVADLAAARNPVAWGGHPTQSSPKLTRDGGVSYWARAASCRGVAKCLAVWSITARTSGANGVTASGRVTLQATSDPTGVRFLYDAAP